MSEDLFIFLLISLHILTLICILLICWQLKTNKEEENERNDIRDDSR